MDAKTMVSIGMILVLAGAALAIVQATWKEEYQMDVPSGLNRDWSLRTQKVGTGSYYNKLDKSYLHIGIGAAFRSVVNVHDASERLWGRCLLSAVRSWGNRADSSDREHASSDKRGNCVVDASGQS